MADRTVKVRLTADISDFVTDIGVKAPAAVKRLEAAADSANKKLATVGSKTGFDDLGTEADTAGAKVTKAGDAAEAAGRKISTSAKGAGIELDKLGKSSQTVDKSTDGMSKTLGKASKITDAHANAIGRLRVAQLRLAEAQKSGKNGSALAGAEESVKAAERAVKQLEKAGDNSGKSFGRRFGAGVKKWFAGDGTSVFKQLGQNAGNGFFSTLFGALKTPIIGPILAVALIAAVTAAAVPAGAVLAGGVVAGFGAGLGVLGAVFAAKSETVKGAWKSTLASMAADMRVLSKPFESTLTAMAVVAKRTFATLKPELSAAFKTLAPALTEFGDQFGSALGKLAPAIQPLAGAFSSVLHSLGPALNDMFSQLSASLIKLSESVQKNPAALADFVRGIGGLLSDLLNFVRIMNDANEAFRRWTGGVSAVTALMYTLRGAVGLVLGPIEGLARGLSAAGDGMNWLAGKLGIGTQVMSQGGSATTSFSDSLLTATTSLTATTNAALHNAHATHEANVQAALAAGAYDRQTAATNRLLDSLNRVSSVLLSQKDAQLGYAQAVADATAAIKENGHTHDLSSQKGRDNYRTLLQVAQAAITQRDSMIKANAGTAAAAKATESAKASFIRLATQMGYGAAEARRMADSLIKIPNVSRTARLNANITDLETKLATAKAKLKDPKLTATQRAKLEADISKLQAGIAAAKAALNSVPASKTVTITANTYRNLIETTTHVDKGVRVNADGGYYPTSKIPSYANGKLPSQAMIAPGKGRGMVQWAEKETGGEAFIPLAPSKRDRSEKILGKVAGDFGYGLVKSFADGGFTLPGGNLVDIAFLLKQLGLPFNPAAGVNYTSTLAAANRANRATVPARDAAIRADRAEQAAKAQQAAIQRAITLQQRAVTAARAPKQTTKAGQAAEDRKVAAEQKKLIALQDDLYRAKQRTTAATKASNAADAVYKIRADAAAKATAAHTAAVERLIEQQKAAVDLANQVASGLTQGANIGDLFSKSLTGKGLLADLQGKGADLGKFGALISTLRKRGVSETLIGQIVAKGPDQGIGIAQAILDGGLALINALNKAQWALEQQANLIGAGSAAAQYGTKIAGSRAGGGGVTAGMTYRVNEKGQEFFTAPINGHVVPAGMDPRRYITSVAGFGGGGSSTSREVHVHQSNYFTGVSMAEADLIAQRANAKAELAARGY